MAATATKRRASKRKTPTLRALQARESRAAQAEDHTTDALTEGSGLTVFGYLIAGMAAYGAIGWLIGKVTHLSMLFPVGMLTGLAISIAFVIYRYGLQGSQSLRKESDR